MSIKTLVINPGSTSTKVGVFEDETLLFEETLRHPTEEIAKYASVIDQKDFRKEIILDFLKEKNCDPKTLNVIVGRGGLLKPIPGGTYAVSDALLTDLKAGVQGQHASNLGGILAREIGDSLGVPSYIVDPVVVDELTDKARISGMPELPRRSIFHALNQKAVARRFAKENGKRYEDLNLIVIHMGGGVSVGAHDHGKVVDVNNILDGEGCFSPERSGTVPVGDLVKMCFSGKYTQKEVYKKICGNGGFNGYLHTNDAREVGKMAESGNALAKQVWEAFFYQIAKDAGAMAAVLHGQVDQIILITVRYRQDASHPLAVDGHPAPQLLLQGQLHLPQLLVAPRVLLGVRLPLRRLFGRVALLLQGSLQLPHIQSPQHHIIAPPNRVRFRQAGQQPGMSRRQKALIQLHFYALRQVQQAQGIGHHRPGFPQPRRYLLLGHTAVLHQAAVALGLLQRGQVLPLQVLYQRQLPHLGVIRLYHDRRDLAQSGHPAGPPAPLPRDDLIHPAGQRAHHHRLQNTMLPDGIRQLRQRVRLKGLSRLVLIGLNIGNAQCHQAAALRRLVIQEQGVQALPQSAFLCHRFLPLLSQFFSPVGTAGPFAKA